MIHRLCASLLTMAMLVVLTPGCRTQATPQGRPLHLYLTWQDDPTTSIVVNLQTQSAADCTVYYDTVSRKGKRKAYQWSATGTRHQIEGVADGRWVHWLALPDLKPGTTYYFTAGNETDGYSEERSFSTISADPAVPLRFVTGGDSRDDANRAKLIQLASAREPAFISIGGDIAYANGKPSAVGEWDRFLNDWESAAVTPTGRTVPMVLAIGNHEVQGGFGKPRENAPFYFGFFAQPTTERSYFGLQMGPHAMLYALDSGHVASHGGEQAKWLGEQLEANATRTPWRFAMYHVPLYPSVRGYADRASERGREGWLSLFENHNMTACFENHDHAYKRTYPLRQGAPARDGVLYLGDGCMGVAPRVVRDPVNSWMAATLGVQHVWLIEATADAVVYRAINAEGQVFDVYPPAAAPDEAEAAAKVLAGMR